MFDFLISKEIQIIDCSPEFWCKLTPGKTDDDEGKEFIFPFIETSLASVTEFSWSWIVRDHMQEKLKKEKNIIIRLRLRQFNAVIVQWGQIKAKHVHNLVPRALFPGGESALGTRLG